jgi:hypothetical protein
MGLAVRQRLIIAVAVLLLPLGCARIMPAQLDGFRPDSQSRPAPWTERAMTPAPGDFHFAIMADRTGGVRPGVYESAIGKVNLLRPDFVMTVGDSITGYSSDAAELDREWDEFGAIIKGLDMRFFFLVGNHDISNPVMEDRWRQRFGRTYYHFLYKDVLFLCLDTQDGEGQAGHIGKDQIAYAQDVLARYPAVRWTFVFMHQPLWMQTQAADLAGWKPIEEALHGRSCTVFAGHLHTYSQSVRDGHDYIILATAGGGSGLGGPFYGEFDHVMWITMTSDGPRYANLMLDGIAAKDVATPATLAYADSVDSKVTVHVEPLIGGPTLSGAMSTTVRLKNDTDLVQRFEGAWEPHPTLKFSPADVRATLKPGEEQVIQLTLQADQPQPLEATPLPRIAWTRRMDPKGYSEVSRSFSMTVPLDTVYPCPRTARTITVDGDLSDWPDLPYRVETRDRVTYPENWSGPEDASFAFATAYDDSFLYVAVKTRDDSLMIDRADVPWDEDSIAVTLDARPEPLRASAPPEMKTQFTSHLLLDLSPSEHGKMMWYAKDHLPAGCQAACVVAGKGIALEIAVPIAYLNDQQGGKWTSFQLNVLDNDVDLSGISRLRWRPDWYGGQTYRGSGTFRKE